MSHETDEILTEEFFPYFRFLRMEQVQDIKNFRKNFCNAKDPECGQRVNAFLSFAMYVDSRYLTIEFAHKVL